MRVSCISRRSRRRASSDPSSASSCSSSWAWARGMRDQSGRRDFSSSRIARASFRSRFFSVASWLPARAACQIR
jgi:hypothetical protein